MMRVTADKMIQTKGPFDLNMSTPLIAFACCLQTVLPCAPGEAVAIAGEGLAAKR